MDIGLAVGGGAADGELLQRAAEAAHGMALEVGEDQHGVIVSDVLAQKVLLDALALGDGELQVGTLGVQQVHGEVLAPAVLFQQGHVLLSGVAGALIGGVALHHGAVHGLDHGLPELGLQEVLVPLLTGVELHGHFAGQGLAGGLVEGDDLFRGDLTGEINLCFHRKSSFLSGGGPAANFCPLIIGHFPERCKKISHFPHLSGKNRGRSVLPEGGGHKTVTAAVRAAAAVLVFYPVMW